MHVDDSGGRRVWNRMCRSLGAAGVGLFIASAFTPLPNLLSHWMGTSAHLEPSEAIVVLGGRLYPQARLSNSSLRRALHGITLYRRGLAPLLVFLGSSRKEGRAEAEVRARLARELGIEPDRILTYAAARTTREEADRVAALLRPRGIRRILLVTDSQHLTRARLLFAQAGFQVLAAPADDFSTRAAGPEERLRLMRRVVEELVARLYYRTAGYL